MGREIRRVPPGWEHPRDERSGDYKALFDQPYKEAAQQWMDGFRAWQDGTHKDLQKHPEYKDKYFYWDWAGTPPNEEYHRQPFEQEPTHYQIYETVSEGTPTSPVFATKVDMAGWLVSEGHSLAAVQGFLKSGWAPSIVTNRTEEDTEILMGIDAMAQAKDSD